jgi:ABC-type polysaccharide/polyol phosphate transport system ATPase subunit
MPIIEVDHVTKEFQLGQPRTARRSLSDLALRLRGGKPAASAPFNALDDVTFTVEAGEVLGIIGHNGAGKSTLLKILAGISKPTRGQVAVRGNVAPLIEVGAGLVPDLTGRENIHLNATILGMKRAEIKRKFDEIVAFSELEDFIDTPVKRYSSGMHVRLGFSIATSVEADILIVDEVLAVGDLAFQRKCFDRMEQLIKRDSRTVLLVSHNIRQVERLCRRVLFMDHGSIRQDGAARTVCNAFYEYSDRRIVTQAAGTRRQTRETTGEVDLIDFSLVSPDGEDTNETEYRDEMVVRIKFLANRRLVNPIFVLGIHTTDFVKVTTTTSSDVFRTQILEPGPYELRVRLRDCPLTPGAYSFRLSLDVEDPIRNIFYCDALCPFSVGSSHLPRTGPELEGFFLLDSEWHATTPRFQLEAAQSSQPLHATGAEATCVARCQATPRFTS